MYDNRLCFGEFLCNIARNLICCLVVSYDEVACERSDINLLRAGRLLDLCLEEFFWREETVDPIDWMKILLLVPEI